MRYIVSLFLVFVVCELKAHNLQLITGSVTDNERNVLAGATIRCFVDDSIFVKGTTTNADGLFRLELPRTERTRRLVFSYLGYNELVVNLQPSEETTIRLGDIVMKKDAMQIHEVVVLGESRVRTEEKLMVFPTKEELRHVYDGYSALDALMLPELNVNTFDHSIKYMNQSVLLCINGREATQSEVRDLDAKSITRVDLYPMGKPEFPQASTVIDYVLKVRDYGGTFGFYANHYLTRLAGDGRATTQYFQGKSEFALSLSGSYENTDFHNKGQTVTTYDFPNGAVTRIDRFMPSNDDSHRINGYFNYIYRDKSQDIYVSLRMNQGRFETGNHSNLQYDTKPSVFVREEQTKSNSLNPGLKLQYTRKLPHSQRLRAELYGSYGDNDYDRWYEHREDDDITAIYRNSTDEKSYYVNGKFNYTKTFPNKSSLNVDFGQDYTHTDNFNLRGDETYDVSLYKSNTRLNATYNYRIKNRFNIRARIAGHISHVRTGDVSTTNAFFTPSIRFSYIYKKHSFTLNGQATSVEASNANRTGDEYRYNEYEIIQGNPDLKDFIRYDALFTHTWNINQRFTWMTYAMFYLNTDMIYRKCEYDESRNSLIWRVQNSGTNWQQHYEGAIQYNIIPACLYVRAGLLFDYDKVNVWKTIYHHAFYAMGQIVFQYKGFRTRLGVLTQPEAINNQTGRISRYQPTINISASYSVDNWNFQLSYENPYRRELRESIDLGIYRQTVLTRVPYMYDNIGHLSVSYRFNYGKKKHKFDNTEVIDINQTTISK